MCAESVNPSTRRNQAWGMTQATRAVPALAPDSVLLDERTPAQLLTFMGGYAGLLNFFSIEGGISGDWTPFFTSDIIFLLAEVATAAPLSTAEIIAMTEIATGDKSFESLRKEDVELARRIAEIARRFNRWLQAVSDYQNAHLEQPINALFDTLHTIVVQRLAPLLQQARAHPAWIFGSALAAGNRTQIELQDDWHELWQATLPQLPSQSAADHVLADAGQHQLDLLAIAESFQTASETVSQLAQNYLAYSLTAAGHPPHSAMYLVFLQLFRHVQDDINRFTGRHLDYYYHDVLEMQRHTSEGDSATLILTLTSTCKSVTLPAGTSFSAGKDEQGRAIQYLTDEPATLNQASIGSLRSLFFGRDAQESNAVSYINAAPVANSKDGLGTPLLQPELGWETFGRAGQDDQAAGIAAEFGFLLTSPVLLLQQGKRTITLTLNLVRPVGASVGASVAMDGSGNSAAAQSPPDLVLDMDSLLFAASGAKNWQNLPPARLPSITVIGNAATLEIVFELDAGADAIVANPALTPGADNPWPMLRVLLNPAAKRYAYSMLAGFTLTQLKIDVEVEGLSDLQLQNNGGAIASGKPFAPFGVTPLPGMAFQVAHPELAVKPLTSLTMNISWLNLPLPPTVPPAAPSGISEIEALAMLVLANGFPEYYGGYLPFIFTNEMYGAAISLYANGGWLEQAAAPPAAGSVVTPTLPVTEDAGAKPSVEAVKPSVEVVKDATCQLFTSNAYGSLTGFSTFEIPAKGLHWSESEALKALTAAPSVTMPGTINLALISPSYAFGHSLFQKLFAVRAIESSNQKQQEAADQPGFFGNLLQWVSAHFLRQSAPQPPAPVILPNQPYTPMISSVSLTYKASDNLAQATRLWHVHPFGLEFPAQSNPSLLPAYSDDGNLYLGLSNVTPGQSLRLHFALREKLSSAVTVGAGVKPPQPVTWRYLSGNQWIDFDASAVHSYVLDFTGSGLVVLELPATLDTSNSIMGSAPDGTFWVAASVAGNPSDYCATIEILPQALTVRRLTGAGAGVPALPLAPASIAGLSTPMAQIKTVLQPYASTGGSIAETLPTYRVRVSERLRHKQRAMLLSDYEQLALEAFPAIAQVKCIGPNQSLGYTVPEPVIPGSVVLAVAGKPTLPLQSMAPLPTPLLAAVANYVKQLASAQVRNICVRNLSYDVLTVNVTVRLSKDAQASLCIKQINDAICTLLAPDLSGSGGHLDIGNGTVPVSTIFGMIKNQPDVLEVVSLTVDQTQLGNDAARIVLGSADTAVCSAPWSVLVSATQHVVTVARHLPLMESLVMPLPAVPVSSQYWLAIPDAVLEQD